MVHVPYKGGGPMVTDLLGGTVQVVIGDQANLMPHVQERQAARARGCKSPALGELPGSADDCRSRRAGIPGRGVEWTRRARPDYAARRREARARRRSSKVMAMPDVREKLQGGGLDPVGDSPEEFARFIPREIAKWSKIAKDVGARAD